MRERFCIIDNQNFIGLARRPVSLFGKAPTSRRQLDHTKSSPVYLCGGAASRMTAPRSSLRTRIANRSIPCRSGVFTDT